MAKTVIDYQQELFNYLANELDVTALQSQMYDIEQIVLKMQNQDPIVKSVIDKYQERSEVGQEKYGTTLERNDLTLIEWMKHLQEELMDATLYLEKLKSELESNPNFPEGHIITKESWDKADKITHEGFIYVKYTDLVVYK